MLKMQVKPHFIKEDSHVSRRSTKTRLGTLQQQLADSFFSSSQCDNILWDLIEQLKSVKNSQQEDLEGPQNYIGIKNYSHCGIF